MSVKELRQLPERVQKVFYSLLVAALHDISHSKRYHSDLQRLCRPCFFTFLGAVPASEDPLKNDDWYEYYVPEVAAVARALVDLHATNPSSVQKFIDERREYAKQMQTVSFHCSCTATNMHSNDLPSRMDWLCVSGSTNSSEPNIRKARTPDRNAAKRER